MPLISPFQRPSLSKAMILPAVDLVIGGERVFLRIGQAKDWQSWRALRQESRAFLTPWEPTWAGDGLTFDHFSKSLRRQWKEWKEGKGYTFFVFLKTSPGKFPVGEPDVKPAASISDYFSNLGRRDVPPQETERQGCLIGGISLTDIQRGVAQRAILGYWIGERFADQGLMTEAVLAVVSFAFDTLKLHRLEASCMPSNTPSRRLLAKTGFAYEGLAPSYLRINGQWEDHELWGKVEPSK